MCNSLETSEKLPLHDVWLKYITGVNELLSSESVYGIWKHCLLSAVKAFHQDKFTHTPCPLLCSRTRKDACLGDIRLKARLDVSGFDDLKEALVPRLQDFVILSTGVVLMQCWRWHPVLRASRVFLQAYLSQCCAPLPRGRCLCFFRGECFC